MADQPVRVALPTQTVAMDAPETIDDDYAPVIVEPHAREGWTAPTSDGTTWYGPQKIVTWDRVPYLTTRREAERAGLPYRPLRGSAAVPREPGDSRAPDYGAFEAQELAWDERLDKLEKRVRVVEPADEDVLAAVAARVNAVTPQTPAPSKRSVVQVPPAGGFEPQLSVPSSPTQKGPSPAMAPTTAPPVPREVKPAADTPPEPPRASDRDTAPPSNTPARSNPLKPLENEPSRPKTRDTAAAR